jgi:hypothetical protein
MSALRQLVKSGLSAVLPPLVADDAWSARFCIGSSRNCADVR